ncbi:Stk1 family PASTA domain-containing Ser/Thr kinase [Fusibacter paucivorans]|uniref:non-specific serine/threonine protein kinase n=1 Tax=Fusibacter paucivorans TaxID=76009 RepID=A0ABS5PSU8_9FIRM|nr:Stk1 family PASTA domain-containing Ser/Thr kinase [Fusibacter paucivorans]MBS7527436.1 Stk1 family PASTA domain-containing Ser/Thr kinase [Fusibacter paucivorans]
MSEINGLLLDNRYEILSVVGSGGMATVYKGRDHVLNRMVAIKVLKQEFNSDSDFVAKFEKESQSAASLSHPNIVNVFDVGMDHDMHYIVMELITGHTLREYLNKMHGFMKEEAVVNIIMQIGSALQHAHQNNIIHRDIKSQNILVSETGSVKVADFGIARAATKSTLVNTKEIVGSVHYASPEQARGGYVDARSDIYSLGILMYELITKELPFDGETPVSVALKQLRDHLPDPRTINANVSDGFASILSKATAKDLNQRYQSIYELMEDLKRLSVDKRFVVKTEGYLNDETTILPKITEEDIMKHDQNRTRKSTKQKASKPVSKLNITLVVVAALIVSMLVFSLVAINKFKEIFNVDIVTVPNVVGMDVDEAVRAIQDKGLVADTTERKYNNDIDEDIVISQNYAEGEELKEGFTVKLVVSNGAVRVLVPNVVQQDLVKARVMIENENFEVGEIKYEFNDLPTGTVISQSPKSGVKEAEGTLIDLVVSQGQEIKTVLVPNVSGKTIREAESELNALGLKLGSIEYELSDEFEEGMIISNQGVGQTYEQGSEVSVVVSNGPENVDGDGTGEGNGDGTENGDGTGDNYSEISVAIFASTFMHDPENIRIEMIQGETRTVVYENTHTKAEGDFRIKIRGTGFATLEVFYSDQLVSQETIQF